MLTSLEDTGVAGTDAGECMGSMRSRLRLRCGRSLLSFDRPAAAYAFEGWNVRSASTARTEELDDRICVSNTEISVVQVMFDRAAAVRCLSTCRCKLPCNNGKTAAIKYAEPCR